MQAQAFVGRVGGLAVALGLGAAVFTGHLASDAAWADAGEDSSSADASKQGAASADSSDDTSPSRRSADNAPSRKDRKTTTADAGDAPSATAGTAAAETTSETDTDEDTDTGEDTEHVEAVGNADQRPPSRPRQRTRSDSAPPSVQSAPKTQTSPSGTTSAPDIGDDVESPTIADTEQVSVSSRASAATAPRTDAVTSMTGQPASAAPVDPPQEPDEPHTAVVQFVSGILDPITASDDAGDPAAPLSTPATWALAAFARRELDPARPTPNATTEIGTVVDVSDIAPVATAADPFTGSASLIQVGFGAVLQLARGIATAVGMPGLLEMFAPLLTSASPPFYTTLGLNTQRSELQGMPVWTLRSFFSTSDEHVVALHGGAFLLENTIPAWINYSLMAHLTGATVVVPIYPLAPQGTAAEVVPKTADLIASLVAAHGRESVSILGESAGGALGLAAAQYIAAHPERYTSSDGELLQASRMVLLSPWLDLTVGDPRSATIDDPIQRVVYLQDAGRLWAGGLDPADPIVSPLYGSLDALPTITAYSGSRDLLSADTLRLRERALAEERDMSFVLLNGGLHGWPGYIFTPEGLVAQFAIHRQLVGDPTDTAALTGSPNGALVALPTQAPAFTSDSAKCRSAGPHDEACLSA